MRTYEIWDLESGNAMGEYETKDAALADVAENVRAHGPSVVLGIALLGVDGPGESRVIAQGDDLLRLVLERSASS